MAKAKYLEGSDIELLEIIKEGLESGEKKDITKAAKSVAELIERQPSEDDAVSIPGLADNVIAMANSIKTSYNEEIAAIEDTEDVEDEDDEDGDDLSEKTSKELKTIAKGLGIKVKGLKKEELIAAIQEADDSDEDEDDDEEEVEVDLDELSLKDLRKLAKDEFGIKGANKMKADKLKAAILAASDEEEEEEDEDEVDYSTMSLKALKAEMRERGIKVKKGLSKEDYVAALEEDDEE